jgi:PAS domain-containing protein
MNELATVASGRDAQAVARSRQLKIVLIESDSADAERIVGELVSAGLELDVVRATNEAEVRASLAGVPDVDAVLCAFQLRELDVFAALEILKESPQEAPLIVVNGGLSPEEAADCMRRGAADYILKGDLGRLPHALTQALYHSQAERDSRDVLRKYLSLFENLPMAVLEATADGEILHANPAAVEMFGFPDLESLLATSVFDLYVEREERASLLARLESEGHVAEF